MKIQVFFNFVLAIVLAVMFSFIITRIYRACYADCDIITTLLIGVIGALLSELIVQGINYLISPNPPTDSSDVLDDEAPTDNN